MNLAELCFKWKLWMLDTFIFKYLDDFQYLKTASEKIMSNQKILTSEIWRQNRKNENLL